MDTHSVHICEDHKIVVEGVQSILNESGKYSLDGFSSTGEECRKALEKHQPEILILDIQLPDVNGLDLMKELLRKYDTLSILILTMHNDPYIVEQVKEHGGKGYLLKDFGKKELLDALDFVRRGEFYKGPKVKSLSAPQPYTKSVRLTSREKEIISLTANGKSTSEIADSLFISEHTVNTHRRNIYKKLDLKDSKQLVKFAYDVGLV